MIPQLPYELWKYHIFPFKTQNALLDRKRWVSKELKSYKNVESPLVYIENKERPHYTIHTSFDIYTSYRVLVKLFGSLRIIFNVNWILEKCIGPDNKVEELITFQNNEIEIGNIDISRRRNEIMKWKVSFTTTNVTQQEFQDYINTSIF